MSRRKRSKSSRGAEGPAPSHNASSQGIKFLFGGAGLVLLVVAAYWPALHAGFVWDDDFMLTNNPVVKSAHGLRYIWFSTALPDYFPLTSTSLWAEWQIWGMKAWAYHLTNVLLHALSTIVLWRIFRMMRWSGAWIMAAIFAVHPVNVESVAWIAERKNVLAMFFYALTWYALLRSLNGEYGRSKEGNNQNSKVHNTDVLHASWYWLSVIFFLLALLSKTAVVMFPFALLLFFWWKNRKLTWPDVLRSLPFFALSLTLGLVTMWFQSHRAIAGDFSETTGIWTKAARAAWAFWFYVYKAVAPFHLSFVYPEWNGTSVFVWVAAVATVILFALLYRYRSSWGRHALFAVGYFGIMLVPVLGFVPIYFHRYSSVANHWEYFSLPAMVALVVTAAYAALSALRNRFFSAPKAISPGANRTMQAAPSLVYTWSGCIGAAAVIALLTFLSSRHSRSFENSERLWADTLRENPGAWMAHNNLGQILASQKRFAEAIEHYAAALRLRPNQPEIRIDLGTALLDAGRFNEAEEQFTAVLKIDPKSSMAYYDLGNVEDRRGNRAKAMEYFRRALQLNPQYAEAHNNLGWFLAAGADIEGATEQFRQAVKAKPDYPDALNNLGSTLTQQGRWLEALSSLRRAIELNPAYADPHYNLANALSIGGKMSEAKQEYVLAARLKPAFAEAHFKLGMLLQNEGKSQEAFNEFSTVIRLRPEIAEAHYRLGFLLASAGQYSAAVEQYKEALRLDPDSPDVLSQLAWIYATNADHNLRNGQEALQLASRAADLTGRKDPGPLDALAAAQAELGQFSVAVNTEELAADVAERAGLADAVQKCRLRVQSYRESKPWRD